eukprot:1140190-Pelagomonas_calceolata.AAC.3
MEARIKAKAGGIEKDGEKRWCCSHVQGKWWRKWRLFHMQPWHHSPKSACTHSVTEERKLCRKCRARNENRHCTTRASEEASNAGGVSVQQWA